jgi:hypothetical protein
MRLFLRACAGLMLLLGSIDAHSTADWQSFSWVGVAQPHLTSDRAAILLPVQLDGNACTMQLDTGAGTSRLYRYSLPKHYAVTGAQLTVEHFDLGPVQRRRDFQLMYDDAPDHRESGCRLYGGQRLVGTIGNDLFLEGSLTLDLKNARFRLMPASASVRIEDENSVPLTLMPGGDGQGQVPVIAATLADGRHVAVLFDTGSAPMELGVFREADWLGLVGTDGARDATTFTVVAWGKPLVCREAPILHAMRIGPVVLDARARASFCVSDNIPLFAGMAQFGLVGLVPFRDKIVTLDYAQKRLSVEAAPAHPAK